MGDAVKNTRKRQNSLMDDEKSTSEHSNRKNSKTEAQTVPPAEVVAKPAESRRDPKHDIEDGVQAEEKCADDLKIKLDEVSAQLEEERGKVNKLTLENKALKNELAEKQERIDELTGKLALSENQLQLQQHMQAVQLPQGGNTTASDAPSLLYNKDLHAVCHAHDIFQLCRPDAISTTSLFKAREEFFNLAASDPLSRRMALTSRQNNLRNLVDYTFGSPPPTPSSEPSPALMNSANKDLKMDDSMVGGVEAIDSIEAKKHHCNACELSMHERAVFDHFVSEGHYKKVKKLKAAVSQAAVTYWLNKLKLQPDAADAASKEGGSSSEEKMDEGDD